MKADVDQSSSSIGHRTSGRNGSPSPRFVIKFVKELDCRLNGTFLADGVTNAAVFACNDEQRIVAEGAQIDEQWTLIQVKPGQVKIGSAESERWLSVSAHRLFGETLPQRSEQLPIRVASRTDREQKMIQYLAGRAPEEVAFPEGLQTYGIRPIAERIMAVNMVEILEQVRKTPLSRQFDYQIGEHGLSLDRIVPGGIIDELGFLAGDIIRFINDTPITSAEDLRYLMPLGDQLTVDFSRDDTAIRHIYHIEQNST